MAMTHDLVVPADVDVDTRFDANEAQRLRALSEKLTVVRPAIGKKRRKSSTSSTTVQLGLVFVPLADLRSHMCMFDFPHSVLASRLMAKTH